MTAEERVYDQVIEFMESKVPTYNQPVHVISIYRAFYSRSKIIFLKVFSKPNRWHFHFIFNYIKVSRNLKRRINFCMVTYLFGIYYFWRTLRFWLSSALFRQKYDFPHKNICCSNFKNQNFVPLHRPFGIALTLKKQTLNFSVS